MNPNLRNRLKVIENRRPLLVGPPRTKAERDAVVAAALADPASLHGLLATLTGPQFVQQRAALEAAMRADT